MYEFAQNKIKLQIAIASATSPSEEDVKARYIELGGLLYPELEDNTVYGAGSETATKDEPTELETSKEEKPKRRLFGRLKKA